MVGNSHLEDDHTRDGGCSRDFLVIVRAVSWTLWFNELYVHIKNLGQTDKQTDTTVYRVAPQLKIY